MKFAKDHRLLLLLGPVIYMAQHAVEAERKVEVEGTRHRKRSDGFTWRSGLSQFSLKQGWFEVHRHSSLKWPITDFGETAF